MAVVIRGMAPSPDLRGAVNLDHIQTVAKSRLGAVITTLGAQRMSEVRSALLFALGSDR
jgi:mRNA-degrading endonuclease toxin of MazEF toxin-antitoxin module